jgi:hypothetical protein
MKSHTSATMTLGSGTICFISTKQKLWLKAPLKLNW